MRPLPAGVCLHGCRLHACQPAAQQHLPGEVPRACRRLGEHVAGRQQHRRFVGRAAAQAHDGRAGPCARDSSVQLGDCSSAACRRASGPSPAAAPGSAASLWMRSAVCRRATTQGGKAPPGSRPPTAAELGHACSSLAVRAAGKAHLQAPARRHGPAAWRLCSSLPAAAAGPARVCMGLRYGSGLLCAALHCAAAWEPPSPSHFIYRDQWRLLLACSQLGRHVLHIAPLWRPWLVCLQPRACRAAVVLERSTKSRRPATPPYLPAGRALAGAMQVLLEQPLSGTLLAPQLQVRSPLGWASLLAPEPVRAGLAHDP